ncbi:sigma 54-interacting transcriptional regulator [Clostridium sp. MB40-C1]|uniref:sigma-54 interaction domain-containing protein n=1 Tax=Clostridium sp. MB40-C1 TaxID=3070996 RepID=UPI0027E106E6|nr:sigma 54-interacting transcriptional regulator [Clostridium sp. MB40-C1]WMJ81725.1 sigma 54-interacting transcriptional regulator [Clostridium sp. MB40-C1]
MQKNIAVVTFDAMAGSFYAQQLRNLFGNCIITNEYSVRGNTISSIQKADLYLVSTDAFDSNEEYKRYIPKDAPMVKINMTFTKEIIEELSMIPKGTKAMLVNLSYKMTREVIASLSSLGINQIEFYPYHPGMKDIPDIDFAITPSENRYVPKNVKRIMDIGQRVMDSSTIVEVALKLKFDDLLEKKVFQEYFASIAVNNYSIHRLYNRSISMESQFEILLSILDEGIIGIDSEGYIFSCNHKAENIVEVKSENLIGKSVLESLPKIPFEECKKNMNTIDPKLIRINKVYINMSISPVIRNKKFIGAFVILTRFSEEEHKQNNLRIQLCNKGHEAKYTFEDIIGKSQVIEKVRNIAKKMAKTKATILITGESGTGKELFSQAIHNASTRKDYPFIAINCAAMADNLLESELFGYEEGAFTGAKKGGKTGLFEFAHRGTIFLDEIEGMSPALQMKLLRVIQEREVTRIGGHSIIQVDVRIIAATNESLEKLVENGTFRKDLYYRLNTLPIELPPLRDRKEDIMLLLEDIKSKVGGNFELSEEAKDILLSHKWDGNVRELHNYVEYFTYMGEPLITIEELPAGLKKEKKQEFHENDSDTYDDDYNQVLKKYKDLAVGYENEFEFILGKLAVAYEQRKSIGRKRLAEYANKEGLFLTEQEIRNMLSKLAEVGLINSSRGRGGSRITKLGMMIYKTEVLSNNRKY